MMRDDPSYVWYEYKRKFKENFKQAAPIGILCTAFVYAQILIWGSLWITLDSGEPFSGHMWYFIAFLAILLFLIITPYIFLHFAYIELKTLQILKNSILMAFAYIPRSFMGALTGGILWFAFALYMPYSLMFLPVVILLAVTLSMLLNLMWVWPPFDKHFSVEETLINRLDEET